MSLYRRILLFVLIAVLLAVGLFSSIGCVSFTSLKGPGGYEKSRVDISSLDQLIGVSLNDSDVLVQRFETLKNMDNRTGTFASQDGGDEVGRIWSCTSGIINGVPEGNASFAIYVFDSAERTSSAFDEERGPGRRIETKKKKTVVLSEDIEAILYPAFRYRNAEAFYMYDSKRSLYTDIRIGNAIIYLAEKSYDSRTIGTLTNQNIELIVQVLLSDAKTSE